MDFTKTTEQASNYNRLKKMNFIELLTHIKLMKRGTKMPMEELNISEEKATKLLKKYENVRTAVLNYTYGSR